MLFLCLAFMLCTRQNSLIGTDKHIILKCHSHHLEICPTSYVECNVFEHIILNNKAKK